MEKGPKWVRISPLKIKNWEQGKSIVPRTGVMGSLSSTTTRAEEQREREKDSEGAEEGLETRLRQTPGSRPCETLTHFLLLGSS